MSTREPARLRHATTLAAVGAALLALAAMLLLRRLLDPWLGELVPFVTLYGAVAVAVWLGGAPTGTLVALLGYVGSHLLFISPRGQLSLYGTPGLVALGAYVATCALLIVQGESLRRRVRQARLQAESQRITLASIADGVIVTDGQGRISTINPVAEALTGWADGRSLGRPLDEVLCLVDAVDGTPLPDPAAQVLAGVAGGQVPGPPGEALLLARDGRRTAVEESAAPLRNALGETLGVVLVLRNVAARRVVAERLRENEARLRENERRLRMALTAARMVAWEIEPGGERLSLTGDLAGLYGLPPGAAPADATQVRALMHPSDRPAHEARVQDALAGGGAYTSRFRVVRPGDGRVLWMEEQAQVFDGPAGARRLAGVVMDITERDRDARLLAGQKRVLERVATGAPLVEVLAELAATIEEHDPSLVCAMLLVDERLRCLRRGAGPVLLDAYVRAIEGVPLGPPHPNPCAAAADTGREVVVTDVENDLRWTAGWRRQALRHGLRACRAVPVRLSDGTVGAVLAIYRREPERERRPDPRTVQIATQLLGIVVERRRASDALAADLQAMTRLQALSTRLVRAGGLPVLLDEVLAAALALTGADQGDIRLVDPGADRFVAGAQRSLGPHLAAQLLGERPSNSTTEAGRGTAAEVMRHGLLGPLHAAALADGVHSLNCTPLTGRDGRLLGLLGTYFHTAQRLDERAQRGLDLLARMTADYIERQHAEQALRDADRRKDEFLATLAHELRNPLAPIRHAVKLLQRQAADPAALHDTTAMLERQVQQLVRLVDDLLDVSRISRGRVPLRLARVELGAVVAQSVEAATPGLRELGHELHVRLPAAPLPLQADPARLVQALGNLLNNAGKFSAPGSRIDLEVQRVDDEAVLTVADRGIGIEAAQLPHIFEMFVQADTSQERSTGGLGIGLTLARCLVELHGGRLEAHSAGRGKGSTFTMRLPLQAAAPAAPPGPRPAAPPAVRRGRHVLVVDDNVDGALSLAELLRLSGHHADVAHSGAQALALAERLRPDVVLLDIGLPGMNGHEVCRRLREAPWGRQLLIVAVTGWGQAADRERSRAAGADAHLVKPVDIDALLALMVTLRPATA